MAVFEKYGMSLVTVERYEYNKMLKPQWYIDLVADGVVIEYPTYCDIITDKGSYRVNIGDYVLYALRSKRVYGMSQVNFDFYFHKI